MPNAQRPTPVVPGYRQFEAEVEPKCLLEKPGTRRHLLCGASFRTTGRDKVYRTYNDALGRARKDSV
jgi:hypothetical protein